MYPTKIQLLYKYCASLFSLFPKILEDILTSALIAGIIYFIQSLRYYFLLKLKFHDKTFYAYEREKIGNNPTSRKHVTTYRCEVFENTIKYKGKNTYNEEIIQGEFSLSLINLKYGEGSYTHVNSDAFGFTKLIIKGSDFYVESSYIKPISEKNHEKIYRSYIWEMKKNLSN